MKMTAIPKGYNTINPFVVVRDAPGFIKFVTEVFDGVETKEARTMDDDGLLIHAEIVIADAPILIFERKPDWRHTPAFLQIYVSDVNSTLEKAKQAGANVITEPSDFYGDILSRVQDQWGNIWWVYQHVGEIDWKHYDAEVVESSQKDEVYHSIIQAMNNLKSFD